MSRSDATIDQLIAGHPRDSIALVDEHGSLTYGELDDLVGRTAGGLLAQVGTGRANVIVLARSERDGIVALLAVHRAGHVACMFDPRQTPTEHAGWMELSAATVALVGRQSIESAVALSETEAGGGLTMLGVAGSDVEFPNCSAELIPASARSLDSPAIELATSGVTGSPRLVELSHRAVVAVQEGLLAAQSDTMSESSVLLAGLPIAHILGLNAGVLTHLRTGAKIVLMASFDPAAALDLIARHGVTSIVAVPPMWSSWVAMDPGREAFSSVTVARCGAATLDPKLSQAAYDTLGVELVQGYGLSESAGTICFEPRARLRPGSVGRPIAGVEVRLVENGRDVEPGDRGEIWLRGSVMNGYVGDPDATKASLTPDGWLRTGDVGVLDDDGSLYLAGRLKDLIIVSGFNVYPAEVEQVIETHPDVNGALVIGEPDDRSGERVVAFVTAKDASKVSAETVASICSGVLSRYKHPREVRIVDHLPIRESGKRVRSAMRT